jgi:hypothetical protein
MRASRGQAAVEAVFVAAIVVVLALLVLRALPSLELSRAMRSSGAAQAAVGTPPEGEQFLGLPFGPAATRIVALAERYAAMGIRETSRDSGVWISRFTDGHAEAWCSDFVSYVLRQGGRPYSGGASGGWRIAGVTAAMSWFRERGRFVLASRAMPLPGDVIFIDRPISWHTGIVVRVGSGVVETVEGNASQAVSRRRYSFRTDPYVVGFGRP